VKILVGSTNPVKIGAVKDAFSRFFNDIEVVAFPVNSCVLENLARYVIRASFSQESPPWCEAFIFKF
jgi:hypothetical protein